MVSIAPTRNKSGNFRYNEPSACVGKIAAPLGVIPSSAHTFLLSLEIFSLFNTHKTFCGTQSSNFLHHKFSYFPSFLVRQITVWKYSIQDLNVMETKESLL